MILCDIPILRGLWTYILCYAAVLHNLMNLPMMSYIEAGEACCAGAACSEDM